MRGQRWTESCTVLGYPSGQDGELLPTWDYLLCPERKNSWKAILIINYLLTKLVLSRWLDYGLTFLLVCLWTSTPSRSINTKNKNLANIQPSWPHIWSITHISNFHQIQCIVHDLQTKLILGWKFYCSFDCVTADNGKKELVGYQLNVDLRYICNFQLLLHVLVVPARLIKILQDWYKHIATHNEQKTLNFQ